MTENSKKGEVTKKGYSKKRKNSLMNLRVKNKINKFLQNKKLRFFIKKIFQNLKYFKLFIKIIFLLYFNFYLLFLHDFISYLKKKTITFYQKTRNFVLNLNKK